MLLTIILSIPWTQKSNSNYPLCSASLNAIKWYRVYTEFGTFYWDGQEPMTLTMDSRNIPSSVFNGDREKIHHTYYPSKYWGFHFGHGFKVEGTFKEKLEDQNQQGTPEFWSSIKQRLLEQFKDYQFDHQTRSLMVNDNTYQLVKKVRDFDGLSEVMFPFYTFYYPVFLLQEAGFDYLVEYEDQAGNRYYFHNSPK